MHVGTGAVWLGWSVLLGSPAVGAVLAAGAAAIGVLVPRWEEVELERRFGDDWRAYRNAVPRWFPGLA